MIVEDNTDNLDDELQDIEELTEDDGGLDAEIIDENYDEVLELTEYVGTGDLSSGGGGGMIVAEYDNINVVSISKNSQNIAKSLVQKITKFILEFDDIQMSETHKAYIKSVSNLELDKLSDLLTLVAVNKQMLENIIRRINAYQAEDFAMINVYNQLSTQHIKLHKEVSNAYNSIPGNIKRMRLDILQDNMLKPGTSNSSANEDGVITKDFGSTQFNNGKQMLKSLIQKHQDKTQASNDAGPQSNN